MDMETRILSTKKTYKNMEQLNYDVNVYVSGRDQLIFNGYCLEWLENYNALRDMNRC